MGERLALLAATLVDTSSFAAQPQATPALVTANVTAPAESAVARPARLQILLPFTLQTVSQLEPALYEYQV